MEPRTTPAFAVWLTGLPASGKSTVAASLTSELNRREIDVAVLESDTLRRIFTPNPTYDDSERDSFYRQIVYIGALLIQHGVPVIFDATANLRRYRDSARQKITRFVEVYLDCPLEVCVARDPKGIYRRARERDSNNLPGLQAVYEAPEHPELLIRGESPNVAAQLVIGELERRGYLMAP